LYPSSCRRRQRIVDLFTSPGGATPDENEPAVSEAVANPSSAGAENVRLSVDRKWPIRAQTTRLTLSRLQRWLATPLQISFAGPERLSFSLLSLLQISEAARR
jgi:hypothetical protein